MLEIEHKFHDDMLILVVLSVILVIFGDMMYVFYAAKQSVCNAVHVQLASMCFVR